MSTGRLSDALMNQPPRYVSPKDRWIDYQSGNANAVFRVRLKFEKEIFGRHIQSIMPDLGDNVGRSTTTVSEDEGNFYIYIEAPDTVSLRASVGSLTRWLAMVDRIFEEVE